MLALYSNQPLTLVRCPNWIHCYAAFFYKVDLSHVMTLPILFKRLRLLFMVAAFDSERINGFRISLPLPNHKGNFNRKTLLYVGRKEPLPSQHSLRNSPIWLLCCKKYRRSFYACDGQTQYWTRISEHHKYTNTVYIIVIAHGLNTQTGYLAPSSVLLGAQ